MTNIRLQEVDYMPSIFEQGVLYVSNEYQIAGHLCACGCGQKVWTPLGPVDWSVMMDKKGPSMRPSIGNGQLNCKSHYVIRNGSVLWCNAITDEDTKFDLNAANIRRRNYYKNLYSKQGFFSKIKNWITALFK
jgi:hypothetical protein